MQDFADKKPRREVIAEGASKLAMHNHPDAVRDILEARDHLRNPGTEELSREEALDLHTEEVLLPEMRLAAAERMTIPVWMEDKVYSAIKRGILAEDAHTLLNHRIHREALLERIGEHALDSSPMIDHSDEKFLEKVVSITRRLGAEADDGIVEVQPSFKIDAKRMIKALDCGQISKESLFFDMSCPTEYASFLEESGA